MMKNIMRLKLCYLNIRLYQVVLTVILLHLPMFAALQGQIITDTLFYNASNRQVKSLDTGGYYRVVSYELAGELQFLVKDFYPSGKIKMTGTFKSLNPDRKHGDFTWFYASGNKRKECSYSENKLNGAFTLWFENGKTQQTSTYQNDKLEGTTLVWSEDGVLKKQIDYKEGMKHGKFQSFYKNGQPVRVDVYKHDVLLEGKCFTATGSDTTYFDYFSPPTFQGGDIAQFKSWILDKLQYPVEARLNKEEGEVKVKFTIDRNGKIKTTEITKEDKNYFNSEVLRVLSEAPLWKPAMQDKESIEVTVEIPVKFTLPKQ